MLINNIDLENFNARVLDIDIQNSSLENKSMLLDDALIPIFFNSTIKLNKIDITLMINSSSKEQYYKDKSNIINNLLQPSILFFKDRNLSFKSVLISALDVISNNQKLGRLKLVFKAYNIQNEVIETMNNVTSKTINIGGNTRIPCIVEVTPTYDLIKLTINGLDNDPIIINNLKSKKTIIIDGESCLVTVGGANNFGNMDMWNFPSLKAGSNTITLDQNTVNINIKFKPRYI